jgi:adenosylcobinamide amidohydrolase
MTYSKKHQAVIAYLRTVTEARTMEIYKHVPFAYYANSQKHMGNLLATMVKRGTIERVKPGVFRLKQYLREVLQPNLFNQNTDQP